MIRVLHGAFNSHTPVHGDMTALRTRMHAKFSEVNRGGDLDVVESNWRCRSGQSSGCGKLSRREARGRSGRTRLASPAEVNAVTECRVHLIISDLDQRRGCPAAIFT